MARLQRIVWADVETTGINAEEESLLQIAIRITDQDLNFVDGDGFERKIWYTAAQVDSMKEETSPFVLDMHTKTGLWDALPVDGEYLSVVDEEALDHVRQYVPEPRTARLAGNSITLDRNFINRYLPQLGEHLHYRSYDVTTIAGMVEMYAGGGKMYNKKPTHEAMDDITESVKEFRHYRTLLFPGARE